MLADDLRPLTPDQLFGLYAELLEELARRGIVRSANNPVADYGEYLVARALALRLTDKSTTGHDAVAPDGTRYEVKSRRVTAANGSRQLGIIRNLEHRHFDFLAGVLFAADFSVLRACLIPIATLSAGGVATRDGHQNGWTVHLRDGVWARHEVRDITAALRAAAESTLDTLGGADAAPSPSPAPAPVMPTARPAATYRLACLGFKPDVIERLGMGDTFRVVTGEGDFEMTRAEFCRDFANVVASPTYRAGRTYSYTRAPSKARRYLVPG